MVVAECWSIKRYRSSVQVLVASFEYANSIAPDGCMTVRGFVIQISSYIIASWKAIGSNRSSSISS